MKKYPVLKQETSRTFSKTIFPSQKKYLMACCDCALVHEMQFTIYRTGKTRKDGTFRAVPVSGYRVGMRLRRHKGETIAQRKLRGIVVK